MGLDRLTLERNGFTSSEIDRVYRALYVYSSGFHELLREVSGLCNSAPTVIFGPIHYSICMLTIVLGIVVSLAFIFVTSCWV